MNENILKSIKDLRSASAQKKRNFPQSFDLIVNLKLFDTKKAENRLNEVVALPHGRGKDASVIVFSDTFKDGNLKVLGTADIDRLSKSKRELKKLSASTDFFLAEPKMMVVIGKGMGSILAPRGKMPTPMTGEARMVIENFRKSVRLKVKDSPVVQCIIGVDAMKDEDIAENVEYVVNFLEKKLPKGKNNVGTVRLKTTMGKPVKLAL
jgi:large subunit ribosomal protein L1